MYFNKAYDDHHRTQIDQLSNVAYSLSAATVSTEQPDLPPTSHPRNPPTHPHPRESTRPIRPPWVYKSLRTLDLSPYDGPRSMQISIISF